MTITRRSSNFPAFLHSLRAEPTVVGFDRVSLGYRQELDQDTGELVTIEVFGNGAPVYSFEWPEDWGAPPSDSDIDAWEPVKPAEVVILSMSERVLSLTQKFNELAVKFLCDGGDEKSPADFLRFVLK